MRNFLQFIWNNQFTILFFLLEFIGFAMLTSNNSYHESRLSSTSVAISGSLAEMNHAYAAYLGLKEENEKLLNENARLIEREAAYAHMGDESNHINYDVQTAHVLNSTYHLGNNYMIIDRGSDNGISTQQGVMGPNGIVGIVQKVSDNYSAVMPIIHSQSLVSCKLGSSGYFGILKWDGKDAAYAYLEDIPNHVGVGSNDGIFTRGASGAFPPDQLVGHAVSSVRNESSGFQIIKVALATDFKSVSNVYVIQNHQQEELDSLIQDVMK